jgi:uncharacterized protein (DUF2249 family)
MIKFSKDEIVSLEDAKKLAPKYVKFIQERKNFDLVMDTFDALKKGQAVLTCHDGVFVRAKVTSVKHDDFRAVDGPVVRVATKEWSWRVDGSDYAWPLPKE